MKPAFPHPWTDGLAGSPAVLQMLEFVDVVPMSRIEVTPLATLRSPSIACACACMSKRPGSRVLPCPSMCWASLGTRTEFAGPTLAIWSPLKMTVWSSRVVALGRIEEPDVLYGNSMLRMLCQLLS